MYPSNVTLRLFYIIVCASSLSLSIYIYMIEDARVGNDENDKEETVYIDISIILCSISPPFSLRFIYYGNEQQCLFSFYTVCNLIMNV